MQPLVNSKMEGNKILNILLADDDQDDRFFFQKALETLEFPSHLITVRDGAQLMNYLDQNSHSLPDIAFVDLNMPKKNGSECLTEIKSNDKLKDLPVIIYSTSINSTIADILYNKGAHYYVGKCEFAGLKLLLQKVITDIIQSNFARPSREKFTANFKVNS